MIIQSLLSVLECVPIHILETWNRSGSLEIHGLISLVKNPRDTSAGSSDEPAKCPVVLAPTAQQLEAGTCSLSSGETALCILYDGNIEYLRRLVHESYPALHIWVITPDSSLAEVKKTLSGRSGVEIFTSFTLPSLTPTYEIIKKNDDYLTYSGKSGDLYGILSEGGTLAEFNRVGGKYILFTQSSVPSVHMHPLLSHHISSGVSITSLVGERTSGFPLLTDDGLIEESDIIDEECLTISGLGTYVLPSTLDVNDVAWQWRRIRRVIHGNVTIEFHRELSQLTRLLPTKYVRVTQNIHNNSCG